MKCDTVKPVLEAYVDGELEALRAVEVERHLQECADCRAAHERILAVQRAVRRAPYHRAPAALLELLQLRRDAETKPAVARRMFVVPWRLTAIAASVLLLACVAWMALGRGGASAEQILAAEVLSAHVRSLQANHLSDVVSSDSHTVRPWFAGKLDFAPPVKDLKEQGFALLGGRLDVLAGRPVAALVYQHGNHVINVFLWPASTGDAGPTARVDRGYHLLKRVRDGMVFYLVSDMDEGELEDLEKLLPAKP